MSDLQIERRKFEEWVIEPGHPEGGYKLDKTASGVYINPETRCAWRGWIGRAQLATYVAAQEPGESWPVCAAIGCSEPATNDSMFCLAHRDDQPAPVAAQSNDKDKRIADLTRKHATVVAICRDNRKVIADLKAHIAAPVAAQEPNKQLSDALKKIDSIAQVLLEGGYGKEGDNRAYREIAGLAETWLRVKHRIEPTTHALIDTDVWNAVAGAAIDGAQGERQPDELPPRGTEEYFQHVITHCHARGITCSCKPDECSAAEWARSHDGRG